MAAGPSFVRYRRTIRVMVGLGIAVGACRGDTTSPVPPASVSIDTPPPAQAVVGTTLAPAPAFIVQDQSGQALAGVPVSVTVIDGDGTLVNAPRQSADGATPIGAWTLGRRRGRNALRIVAGALPPMEVAVEAIPDQPAALVIVQGDKQTALAGDRVSNVLAVRVEDRFGNGVSNVGVTFAVSNGGGDVAPVAITSGGDGIAAGAEWRLGKYGGVQTLVARAGAFSTAFVASIRSDYNPDLRYFGTPPSLEIQSAFTKALARIHASIISDLPDIPLLGFDMSRCGVPGVTLQETVNDILIFASVTSIDGPGNILASATPCITRAQSRFVVVGVMRFDVEDLNSLSANGSLDAVILHELLHMVGFGSLWHDKGLVLGAGTNDPRFTGALADTRCISLDGAWACGDGTVPVENVGGSGTIGSHWRESVFHSELMTGFAEPNGNMPMSTMTLGSLEDLGLQVNYLAADPYVVPPPSQAAMRLRGPSDTHPWEVLEPVRFDVTPGGWVRPLTPP